MKELINKDIDHGRTWQVLGGRIESLPLIKKLIARVVSGERKEKAPITLE